MLTIELAGEQLQLHHERALYWAAANMLIVADTHFGKDGIFRQHAIPVPEGTVAHDLDRLGTLLRETNAQRLVVLGDFIHGYLDSQQPFIEQFRHWRREHAAVDIDVVLGNHDRRINRAHYDAINWYEDYQQGPFVFVHEPCHRQEGYVLCGHVHPVMRLTAGRGDAMRLPVFWFTNAYGTLPSFGSMTGGFAIKPDKQDRLYAVGPDEVVALGS